MASKTKTENSTSTSGVGSTLTPEQKLTDKFGKLWNTWSGKNLDSTLGMAKVQYEAKAAFDELTDDPFHYAYPRYLSSIRLNQSKASMYRKIHQMFLEHPELKEKYRDQLPSEYSKLYQLAKVVLWDLFSPEKAEQAFTDTLAYMNTTKNTPDLCDADGNEITTKKVKGEAFVDQYPTTADITKHVDVLLGKVAAPAPQTQTAPAAQTPTINDVPGTPQSEAQTPIAALVDEALNAAQTAANEAPPLTPEQEAQKAEADALRLAEKKKEDALHMVSDFAWSTETEYSPEEIAEAEELLFADDDNDVQFETFNGRYAQMRLRCINKLALQEMDMSHFEVIFRLKSEAKGGVS